MTLRLVLFCIATFLIFSPSVESQNVFSSLIQSIKKFIPSSTSRLKFINDSLEFAQNELKDITPSNKQEYDFIIVGAGSAGATIANRLTEIKKAKVLLIEAGSHESLFTDITLLDATSGIDKSKQWSYLTEPSNQYCLGIDNNQCKVPLGKVMGGSSSASVMIASRGIM